MTCSPGIPLALLVGSLLVVGCGGNHQAKAVPDSTMVEVLVELHLANGRIEVTDQPLPIARDSIFEAYSVDTSAYAATIDYYARNPEDYSRVYGRVVDRLSAERIPTNQAAGSDSVSIQ